MIKRSSLLLVIEILFLSFLCSETVYAIEPAPCLEDTVIVIWPNPEIDPGGRPRSEVFVPISASYDSMLSSVILYFTSNLGEIEVEVLNTTTGGYVSGMVDTSFLSATVPITFGSGHYILLFTLPSGQRYRGEFDV
ncbi:MAG: DUF3244 domain-containing protein [Bacteroidales bacterium]|nr:DUF3244 domain-containing protein [Bacteroidales bacterium]